MANVSMRDKALELVHGLMYDQFAMVPTHTNMKNFAEGKDHGLTGGHYTVKVKNQKSGRYFIVIEIHTHTQEYINFCHENNGFRFNGTLYLHYFSNTNWELDYFDDAAEIKTITKLDR